MAKHARSRSDAMRSDLGARVRAWLPRGTRALGTGARATGACGTGTAFLSATIGLLAVGTVVLAMGFVHHATSVVFASLMFNGLALAPLALFYGSSRDEVPSLVGSHTVPLEWGRSERLHCARCRLPLSPLRVTTSATAVESCHCYESSTASKSRRPSHAIEQAEWLPYVRDGAGP